MPFVTIYIPSGKSPEYIKAVGDSVNTAVIETMGFPADDRYQIIQSIDNKSLQFQERTGDRVMMHLVMRIGRSDQSKQAFYKKVAENLSANPGISPQNILITITENHDVDWSFRDGVAQFMITNNTAISQPASKTIVPAEQSTLIIQDYLVLVVVVILLIVSNGHRYLLDWFRRVQYRQGRE
jgi:phenylpyruvate tautomerase PptA (4-oxalocrotonate tautomerase family)